MSSLEHIPAELWLEILSPLPHDSILAISSTSHSFRHISRPLVFANFHFYPYPAVGAPRLTDVDRSLGLLQFWSSDDVAPLVRSCIISLQILDARVSETLLAAVLERLPRFSGLRRLRANYVGLTQAAFKGLCRLSALDALSIFCCYVRAGHSIDLTSLSLAVSCFEIASTPVNRWIPLLRSDRLRELSVTFGPDDDRVAFPSFPHVRKLSAVWIDPWREEPWEAGETLRILSNFPALEVLAIRPSIPLVEPGPRATDLFPFLTEYSGPSHTLRLFLALPTLVRLEVHRGDTSPFLVQLEGVQPRHNITSFEITFDADTAENAVFDTLCALFPRLTALRISIEPYYSVVDGLVRPSIFRHRNSSHPHKGIITVLRNAGGH
ncbi:hypothetical protein DFH09DRAFT_1129187 [Mycena vulgaris]|nr:hypothetical protein DFH09DRAFT_1129187 [Mycena vulgaris]